MGGDGVGIVVHRLILAGRGARGKKMDEAPALEGVAPLEPPVEKARRQMRGNPARASVRSWHYHSAKK
jgi:hypothetical protein